MVPFNATLEKILTSTYLSIEISFLFMIFLAAGEQKRNECFFYHLYIIDSNYSVIYDCKSFQWSQSYKSCKYKLETVKTSTNIEFLNQLCKQLHKWSYW